MATFPIYTTDRTVSGRSGSVKRSYDTSTGGEYVGRALSNLGGAMFEVGSELFRAQGEAEFAEKFNGDIRARIQDLGLHYDTNSDVSTYQKKFDDTFSDIEATEFKNGWARKQFQLALPGLKASQKGVLDAATAKRVKQNWDAQADAVATNAVQGGNIKLLESYLDNGVSTGMISKEERDAQVAKTRHSASQQKMAALVGNDPDWFLETVKNPADMERLFPDSIPTDWAWARGLAQAAAAERKYQKDRWWDAIVNDTLGKARTMDVASFRMQLAQTPGITEEQRTELMQTYLGAAKLWQETGQSPFVVTRNEASLAQTILDIERGEIKSLEEINERYLADKTVNWSTSDMLMVKRLWKAQQEPTDENNYSRSHPIASAYFGSLTKAYMGDEDTLPENRRADFVTKYKLLERVLKDNWNNPAKMDAAFEALMQPIRKENAKKWLGGVIGADYWRDPFGLWPSIARSEPTEVASHEDAEKLPAGTQYVLPNDNKIYRKL